jgi:hypothetical protein
LIACYGNPSTGLSFLYGVAVDLAGNIYRADGDTSDNGGFGRVAVLSSTGVSLHAFPNASNVAAGTYRFDFVPGVAIDLAGNIYVADEYSDNGGTGRVMVLSLTGVLLHVFPDALNPATNYSFHGLYGVAVDLGGNIHLGDSETSANGGEGRVVALSLVDGDIVACLPECLESCNQQLSV